MPDELKPSSVPQGLGAAESKSSNAPPELEAVDSKSSNAPQELEAIESKSSNAPPELGVADSKSLDDSFGVHTGAQRKTSPQTEHRKGAQGNGGDQMRRITLFGIAVTLIVGSAGFWSAWEATRARQETLELGEKSLQAQRRNDAT
jgi:hypothetical protein